MNKIILTAFVFFLNIALFGAPTKLTDDQLELTARVTANEAQTNVNALNIGTHTLLINNHTDQLATITADIASNTAKIATLTLDLTTAQSDITTLQNDVAGKVSKSGDEITGVLKIRNDLTEFGSPGVGSSDGNVEIKLSGYVGAGNATATIRLNDSTGKVEIVDGNSLTTIIGNPTSTSATFQDIYDNETSGQGTVTMDASGFLVFKNNSSQDIFRIDEATRKVTIYEALFSNNVQIDGNLNVNGTQTSLNTDTIYGESLFMIPVNNLIPIFDIEPPATVSLGLSSPLIRFKNANGGDNTVLIDYQGKYNGIQIDRKTRSADMVFWKKGKPALGDVFGEFLIPRSLTVQNVNSQLRVGGTTTPVTFAINIRESVAGSYASSTASSISLNQNSNRSATEVASGTLTDSTYPKGTLVQLVVTGVDSADDAEDLTVSIEAEYDN